MRDEGELAVRAAFAPALFVRPAVMFGPDDAFLTTILRLLRQLPIYPMFGHGLTRLQPAYVEDVAEAIGRSMQRAETPSTILEFGGPRVYSYEELLRAVAHQAGLAPRLIPIPVCGAYRKSHPAILMVHSAQDRAADDIPGPLNAARDRGILVQ